MRVRIPSSVVLWAKNKMKPEFTNMVTEEIKESLAKVINPLTGETLA